MKEKNSAKITSLFSYFANDALLTKIRKESKFQDERRTIFSNLEILLSTVAGTSGPETSCQSAGCERKKVSPQDSFPGSDLCAMHHYKKYGSQTESPSFAYWLKDETLRNVMMSWLQQSGHLDVIGFSQAVDQYKAISRAQMRGTRAPVIYKKFIESKAVSIDGKTSEAIKKEMEASGDSVSKQLFNTAQTQVLEGMQTVFEKGFVGSKDYKDWVAKVTLPPAIHKEVLEQYSKAKEADLNLKKLQQEHSEKEGQRLQEKYEKSSSSPSSSSSSSSSSS